MLSMSLVLVRGVVAPSEVVIATPAPAGQPMAPSGLSPVFTPEVQYWAPYILRWAEQYNIEANILATVIQIESCGDWQVASVAGAQGLFQVMPFHFQEGEDMLDPETNALRGVNYLLGGLELADGHIGLAMAGYNGGWGVIGRGWDGWYNETRRYYIWGSGIYMDALAGKSTETSEALQNWLNAGGVRLCQQASMRQALLNGAPPTGTLLRLENPLVGEH
jgi:hypothetical protein